jgi:hypothetical protein
VLVAETLAARAVKAMRPCSSPQLLAHAVPCHAAQKLPLTSFLHLGKGEVMATCVVPQNHGYEGQRQATRFVLQFRGNVAQVPTLIRQDHVGGHDGTQYTKPLPPACVRRQLRSRFLPELILPLLWFQPVLQTLKEWE